MSVVLFLWEHTNTGRQRDAWKSKLCSRTLSAMINQFAVLCTVFCMHINYCEWVWWKTLPMMPASGADRGRRRPIGLISAPDKSANHVELRATICSEVNQRPIGDNMAPSKPDNNIVVGWSRPKIAQLSPEQHTVLDHRRCLPLWCTGNILCTTTIDWRNSRQRWRYAANTHWNFLQSSILCFLIVTKLCLYCKRYDWLLLPRDVYWSLQSALYAVTLCPFVFVCHTRAYCKRLKLQFHLFELLWISCTTCRTTNPQQNYRTANGIWA